MFWSGQALKLQVLLKCYYARPSRTVRDAINECPFFYVNATVRQTVQKRKNHVFTEICPGLKARLSRTCAIRHRSGLSCRKLVASRRRLSESQASSGGSLEPGVVEPYLTE
jgi:hypothetical protein